jgi:hypothetical protein
MRTCEERPNLSVAIQTPWGSRAVFIATGLFEFQGYALEVGLAMEQLAAAQAIAFMLVGVVGIFLYVALVIAIPVCAILNRLLDKRNTSEAQLLDSPDPR